MMNISMTLNYVSTKIFDYQVPSPLHRKTVAINLKTALFMFWDKN